MMRLKRGTSTSKIEIKKTIVTTMMNLTLRSIRRKTLMRNWQKKDNYMEMEKNITMISIMKLRMIRSFYFQKEARCLLKMTVWLKLTSQASMSMDPRI